MIHCENFKMVLYNKQNDTHKEKRTVVYITALPHVPRT